MGVVNIGGIHTHPCMSIHPHTSICPSIPPCTSICFSLYHMFPICHGDLGASLHPMSWVFLGCISMSIRNFCICWYIHCFSIHNSHTRCSPSLWVVSLLDWIPAMLHAVVPFFVVFSLCFKLLLPWL